LTRRDGTRFHREVRGFDACPPLKERQFAEDERARIEAADIIVTGAMAVQFSRDAHALWPSAAILVGLPSLESFGSEIG
jgi:hypothetical protein